MDMDTRIKTDPVAGRYVAPASYDEPPLRDVLRDLLTQTGALLRAEADVIKLELQESSRTIALDALKTSVAAGIALLGLFSLLAFAIMALGDLIGGGVPEVRGFWISALIIGVLLAGGGGFFAMRHGQRIGRSTKLPRTRTELVAGKEFVKHESVKIKESATP